MGVVAFTKGVAWGVAALAAFPAGIVSAALMVEGLAGPRRQVEVVFAGAEISAQGARYVDFASRGVLFSQVCDGACDQVSLAYPDHRKARFHSWLRAADQTCISCAEGEFDHGETIRVGAKVSGLTKTVPP